MAARTTQKTKAKNKTASTAKPKQPAKAAKQAGPNKTAAKKSVAKKTAANVAKKSAAKKSVAKQTGPKKSVTKKPAKKSATKKSAKRSPAKAKLLSGGNPQIAKGDGDAPVQAYIAALPGWKRDVARRLDALIVRNAPKVRKAVKWNSPFYGSGDQSWFLSFHAFTKYLKVGFFSGASLRPLPPGESKSEATRYLDIFERDTLNETQMAKWIRQAAKLPGWKP